MGPRWNAIGRTLIGRSGNALRNRYLVLMRQQQKKRRNGLKEYHDVDYMKEDITDIEIMDTSSSNATDCFMNIEAQMSPTSPTLTNSVREPVDAHIFTNNDLEVIDLIFKDVEDIFKYDEDCDFIRYFF